MKKFKSKRGAAAKKVLSTHKAAIQQYITNSFEVDCPELKFSGAEHVCGIEHLLDERVLRMLAVCKSLTVQRVLDEQNRQRKMGEKNAELLAQASVKSSMFSTLWRRRIARINSASAA